MHLRGPAALRHVGAKVVTAEHFASHSSQAGLSPRLPVICRQMQNGPARFRARPILFPAGAERL
jgi:hypothetical protein